MSHDSSYRTQPMPVLGAVDRSIALARHAVGKTDTGAQRDQNEDALFVDDNSGVYVVCDGMGGHASGQLASELAIRTVAERMLSGERDPTEPLVSALKHANKAIYEHAQFDESCRGMGTTAVGLRFHDEVAHVCHCGDSRGYLLRQGQLVQLTMDHSLENLYRQQPELEQKWGPATSNVIVRAIGLEPNIEIEHQVVTVLPDDVFLLCCDGLSDLVEDWMIREIMTSGDNLDTVATNLIRAANTNGGTDNITVILVHVYRMSPPQEQPTVTL